jgi:hypothetical protein
MTLPVIVDGSMVADGWPGFSAAEPIVLTKSRTHNSLELAIRERCGIPASRL